MTNLHDIYNDPDVEFVQYRADGSIYIRRRGKAELERVELSESEKAADDLADMILNHIDDNEHAFEAAIAETWPINWDWTDYLAYNMREPIEPLLRIHGQIWINPRTNQVLIWDDFNKMWVESILSGLMYEPS